MAAEIRKPQWLNELSLRFGRKHGAMTNLSERYDQNFQLVWWPRSHLIEQELPALLERIAIDVDVVSSVRVSVGDWEIPEGELMVMGEPVPVAEHDDVKSHEIEVIFADGRKLIFDVYYPVTNRPRWAKLFGVRAEERWIDDGGNNASR